MYRIPLDRHDTNVALDLWTAADGTPDAVAVVERASATSYGTLRARASAIASALAAAGARPGDRIGVLLPRGADAAASYFAALAVGGVPVVVNEALHARQTGYVLEHSGAAYLVTSQELLAPALGERSFAGRTLLVSDVEARGEFVPIPRTSSDLAQIVYTSGSTGLAKGVTFSHGNVRANLAAVPAYLRLVPEDRVLSLLPFSSVYGLNQLICSVACGSTLVVERSPLAHQVLLTVREQGVTVLAAVPPLWLQLLRAPEMLERAAPTLRVLQNAGGHLPEHAVRALRAAIPHARLYLQYGMTEVMRSTYLAPEEVDRRPASMGKAMPGVDVRVIGEEGRACAPGEIGELVHRGPTVALGYWNDPRGTARTFRPDPLAEPGDPYAARVVYSGDLVRFDEEGFLYYVGRRDRVIKSMGYRVGPDEVADVLFASGEVREALVTSEPDELWGSAIVAFVVLGEGGSLERLRLFCRREMPRHMQPKRFDARESLPRLPGGKYDLAALLEEVAAAR